MIQPAPGVAFTWADDGDMRADPVARAAVAARLGIGEQWALVNQVHGSAVHVVQAPGAAGAGDALVTTRRRLPLAVFTADCLGIVLIGPGVVGVAHAGWRGLAAGVVEASVAACRRLGHGAVAAYIGPGIGPCCFEVGADVSGIFSPRVTETTWGTPSVDLAAEAEAQLENQGVATKVDERCTACGDGHSHRRDGSSLRMATLGWLL